MKIGLLAYCSACNFGAQLQLLSSFYYFKKRGFDVLVIDWMPYDLEEKYKNTCINNQLDLFEQERLRLWKQSRRCNTEEEIALLIVEEHIDAMVVGSDAVLQHHPFWECVKFPTKRFIGKITPSSDTVFPNPFWGTFNDYLKTPIPVVILSGSNQDSRFGYIGHKTKRMMNERLRKMKYISVRDTWTQAMIANITRGNINPNVTPDPVFAFNYNASEIIPSKEHLLQKFGLKPDYLLFSFHDKGVVSQEWLDEIQVLAEADGLQCVKLPYADVDGFGVFGKEIELPLSPIDWYGLIKYSKGYIGQNMHPIVVALHNMVPFFAFDNYGIRKLNGLFVDESTSKILHILKLAGLEKNRVSCVKRNAMPPTSHFVYDCVKNFDTCKATQFSNDYYNSYVNNMLNIESVLLEL